LNLKSEFYHLPAQFRVFQFQARNKPSAYPTQSAHWIYVLEITKRQKPRDWQTADRAERGYANAPLAANLHAVLDELLRFAFTIPEPQTISRRIVPVRLNFLLSTALSSKLQANPGPRRCVTSGQPSLN